MNEQEAVARIRELAPGLTEGDVRDLMSADEVTIEALVVAYQDSGAVASRALWDEILEVAGQVQTFAGAAMIVAGVVGRVVTL